MLKLARMVLVPRIHVFVRCQGVGGRDSGEPGTGFSHAEGRTCGHGARDFACSEYFEGRAFAHPTGVFGRRSGDARAPAFQCMTVPPSTAIV